jgi:hypothetical protein
MTRAIGQEELSSPCKTSPTLEIGFPPASRRLTLHEFQKQFSVVILLTPDLPLKTRREIASSL